MDTAYEVKVYIHWEYNHVAAQHPTPTLKDVISMTSISPEIFNDNLTNYFYSAAFLFSVLSQTDKQPAFLRVFLLQFCSPVVRLT